MTDHSEATGESPVTEKRKRVSDNMPITRVVYGEDHPRFRPPYPAKETREHDAPIFALLDDETFKRLTRRFPRIRKLTSKREELRHAAATA